MDGRFARTAAQRPLVWLVFACLVLLLVAPYACLAARKSGWIEVRSPHFTVDSNSGKGVARATALQFEQIREALGVFLPLPAVHGEHLTILAVDGESSFKQLLPGYFKKRGTMHPAGVFVDTGRGAYIVLRADEEVPGRFEPVYHEYAHYVMRKSIPDMPLWLVEGLADFFSDTRLRNNYAYVGAPDANDLDVLRSTPLLPLKTLLAVDRSSPYYTREDKVQIFYAESWALTHYLLLRDAQHHTQNVDQYIHQVAGGGDSVQSFTTLFGPLHGIDNALNSYVHQLALPAEKFPLTQRLSSKDFQVSALPQPAALAVQAQFLLDTGHDQEAGKLLQKALKADPHFGKTDALMSELKLHEGARGEAADWAAKAISADPQDYLGYLDEALARGGSHADATNRAAVERDFQHALALRPDVVGAEIALSELYVVRRENPSKALALALDAVQQDPECSVCLTNLEVALLQQGRQADAVRIEMRMLRRAHDPKAQAIVRNNLGWTLMQDNVWPQKADFEIREAAQLAPQSAAVMDSLGYLLKKEDHLADAAAAYRSALAINPKTVSSLDGLGAVLAAQHNYSGAIAEYRAAIAVDAGDARAHYGLSSALQADGQSSEATQELKAATDLDPFGSTYP